jgi:tetratricopeptide (TPR) repeat protein
MRMRRGWVWVAVVLLGQRALVAGETPPADTAETAWQEGQKALLAGKTDQAIACYQRSLALDPGLNRNHLSLAAAYLARGEEAEALPHLAHYLHAQPDHFVVRAHYAELLLRLEKPAEARREFERFVADAQDNEALARQHLIHCHSRLMEIAETQEDEYGEHLHRGIGLYLLACQRATLADADCTLSSEALLCRAAGELTMARLRKPDEARPCWYLYEVWSHLAQRQPALRWLRAAQAAAPFSHLTPAEQRGLYLAGLQRDDLGRK